jgi:hypothetical protein
MVPVDEADDAEEAEDESSSCCSSVSKWSVCSSSSASSKITGGMVGRAVSLDLAKALWRSLIVGRSRCSMQHAKGEGDLRAKWLAMCPPAFQSYLKLEMPREIRGGDVGVGDFVVILLELVGVV